MFGIFLSAFLTLCGGGLCPAADVAAAGYPFFTTSFVSPPFYTASISSLSQRYTLLDPALRPVRLTEPVAQTYGEIESRPEGKKVLSWETGENRSCIIPAIEIPSFVLAFTLAARVILPNDRVNGKLTYQSTPSTFFDHIFDPHWTFDLDKWNTSQINHPLMGTVYYGFARSAGQDFWTSLGYTFMGSFLWETGGETDYSSINDQFMTGIIGAFFGESLFRMASLVLEGGGENPGFWRELGATFISPSAGFNRLVFGERFSPVFPSHDPALFWRLDLEETNLVDSTGHVTGIPRVSVGADLSLLYGLPGKPGYSYDRPFDYFDFELAAATGPENLPQKVITKGLIFGTDYEAGDAYRGIWGLYGSFDYINTPDFRVGTGALDIGTNGQWWFSKRTALQLAALTGIGYGAAGTVPGSVPDYHHGGAAQALLDLRLIFGDLAMLELGQREYFIDMFGRSKPTGNELMGRTEVGLTVRISGRHAVALKFLSARRDEYPPGSHNVQTMNQVTLSYTFMSDENFGAVEWREQ
jgi:hypothetical protein